MYERPLDLLNSSKQKEVLVQLKSGKQIVGTLLAFDININIVLENSKEMEDNEIKRGLGIIFIRGDSVVYISPSKSQCVYFAF